MPFIGNLSGKQYESREVMLTEERRFAALRDRDMIAKMDAKIAEIPLDTLKALADREAINESISRGAEVSQFRGDVFVQYQPAYIDTPSNALAMKTLLLSWGVVVGTNEDFQRAFDFLHARGMLKVDQKALQQQHADLVRETAQRLRDRGIPSFDEEEAETLSMDELRGRANEAMHRG